MRKHISALTVVLLLAVWGVQAQTETELEPTTFFMTFVPNVQFAQMYVGLERGYFEEAGYDLSLEYGAEPDGVELIALGERSYGLIAGEQVLTARANGRPVVSVYEWWQQYPIVIATSVESGIETPQDLAGRRVGVPGRFGATYAGLIALLNAGDLVEADVDLREIGFSAPEVLCVGGVEASAVYGNNEPQQVSQRIQADDCEAIEAVSIIRVSDYVDMVSNGVVTNEEMIAEQPERVRALVAAFDQSVADVIHNPFDAYLLSESYIENLPLTDELRLALESAAAEQQAIVADTNDRAEIADSRNRIFESLQSDFSSSDLLQLNVLMQTVELWDADRLGLADAESWRTTQEILLQMNFIEEPTDVDAAFTNDFLPETE